MQQTDARSTTINVTVTFPISPKGSFHTRQRETETVGALRDAAMQHFGATADEQHVYYLTHNRHKVPETETIGEVVGRARAAKFSLIKELVQG